VGVRFSLHQFSDVFQVRNPAGQLYVLVGGQAVNYWAERYLNFEPGLNKYLPFTSEDIDFCGNREDVQHIAGQLKLVPAFPPSVAMTMLAGAIPLRLDDAVTNIEIIRNVPGMTASAVNLLAVQMEWQGRSIRLLDPISLLIGKVELALTVSQEKRQDARHLQMLFFCVRGFLRELLVEVESGNVPAKAWLGAVNRLIKLSNTTHGRKAGKKFGIGWSELLPVQEINKSSDTKITRFREKQLTRGFGAGVK
jgi:hypothetical protein